MPELARLILLLVALAVFWNFSRGTLPGWLRAKFLGEQPPAAPTARRRAP